MEDHVLHVLVLEGLDEANGDGVSGGTGRSRVGCHDECLKKRVRGGGEEGGEERWRGEGKKEVGRKRR